MDAAKGASDERSERRKWLIAFIAVALIAIVGACVTIRIWRLDLSVPFEYEHDGLLVALPVKVMLEQGWWYTHDRLGAPLGMEFYDYPSSPNLHLAILKLMSFFERDAFRLINYYFLLSFPLIAVCMLAALRAFRLPVLPAAFASLIFAFAPYHYWRGIAHLWLGCYFTVPLGMIAVAWVLQDRRGLLFDASESGRWKFRWRSRETILALLFCAALGFDFPYYPIFIAFLLLVAGPYAALHLRSWRPLVRSGALIVATAGFFVLNLLPNILYQLENGPNTSPTLATIRPWNHAEQFGLKITALLMPAKDHPIPALEAIRAEYLAGTAVVSSADAMALGAIAAGGFLALLAWSLFRTRRAGDNELMDSMSVLNLACVLLATVGGLGALANLLSIRALRCYDRISIVIMFLALVPVCILLASLERRVAGRRWATAGYRTMLGILLVGGVWEQSRYHRQPGDEELAVFRSDRDLIKTIETRLGGDAAIFQYPVQDFLSQAGPAINFDPYTHIRGFMHSDTLSWSYGAVVGREASALQRQITSRGTDQAVESLALVGFDGIYVDRRLYADGGRQFESELRDVLKVEPIVSENGRLAVYPMTEYAAALAARMTPEQREQARLETLHPFLVEFADGFDVEEIYPTARFRWCRTQHGRIRIVNPRDEPRTVEMTFSACTNAGQISTLRIEAPSLQETLPIADGVPETITRRIVVPPGVHYVDFRTDAEPLVTPFRNVVFRINEFDYTVEDAVKVARSQDETTL